MKYFLFFFCITVAILVKAQSPGLSVVASMNTEMSKDKLYKIEMKFCWPNTRTGKGGWFTHDTSAINFKELKVGDISCGKFSGNGEGVEVLSGNKEFTKYNFYEYGNQVFAWENVLVFRITDSTSGAQLPAMYIVLPVRYKSFVTRINIEDILFQPGKLLFLDKAEASYKENHLLIQPSLENVAGIAIKDSPAAKWIE